MPLDVLCAGRGRDGEGVPRVGIADLFHVEHILLSLRAVWTWPRDAAEAAARSALHPPIELRG